MANQNFMDELYKGLGNAVADIREKVVEEAYFGKVVNERQPEVPQWPEAREQASVEEHTQEQEKQQKQELER